MALFQVRNEPCYPEFIKHPPWPSQVVCLAIQVYHDIIQTACGACPMGFLLVARGPMQSKRENHVLIVITRGPEFLLLLASLCMVQMIRVCPTSLSVFRSRDTFFKLMECVAEAEGAIWLGDFYSLVRLGPLLLVNARRTIILECIPKWSDCCTAEEWAWNKCTRGEGGGWLFLIDQTAHSSWQKRRAELCPWQMSVSDSSVLRQQHRRTSDSLKWLCTPSKIESLA